MMSKVAVVFIVLIIMKFASAVAQGEESSDAKGSGKKC